MKRAIVAAVFAAGAGLLAFTAPAEGATIHAGVMTTSGLGFRYANGDCGHVSGNGTFSVAVGDSITWTNCTQSANHTVTFDSLGSTGPISYMQTTSFTFSTPGTFGYSCDIHPTMQGVVNVTGPAPTVPQTSPATEPPTTTKATTTSSSTPKSTTTTTDEFGDVFADVTSPPAPPTSFDATNTTRALGQGGNGGTSAGTLALIVVGLGAVGTAAALVLRRMRAA
jgi:plastocyanin